jgi:hypothetical protein
MGKAGHTRGGRSQWGKQVTLGEEGHTSSSNPMAKVANVGVRREGGEKSGEK